MMVSICRGTPHEGRYCCLPGLHCECGGGWIATILLPATTPVGTAAGRCPACGRDLCRDPERLAAAQAALHLMGKDFLTAENTEALARILDPDVPWVP